MENKKEVKDEVKPAKKKYIAKTKQKMGTVVLVKPNALIVEVGGHNTQISILGFENVKIGDKIKMS